MGKRLASRNESAKTWCKENRTLPRTRRPLPRTGGVSTRPHSPVDPGTRQRDQNATHRRTRRQLFPNRHTPLAPIRMHQTLKPKSRNLAVTTDTHARPTRHLGIPGSSRQISGPRTFGLTSAAQLVRPTPPTTEERIQLGLGLGGDGQAPAIRRKSASSVLVRGAALMRRKRTNHAHWREQVLSVQGRSRRTRVENGG